MKNGMCTIIGIVGGAIAAAFGGWDTALAALVTFMAIDYITGLMVAGIFHTSPKTESGALESLAGWKGLCRKGVTLLVALVWSVLSTVLAALAWMAEISVVGRENVFSLIAQGLRSLRQHLSGNLTGCAAALVVLCLVSCLVSFLKFYAAISLGHSFSNHKVLLSVVFYIGFGIVTQTIGTIFASVGIQIDISPDFWSSLPVTQVFSSLAWAAAGVSALLGAAYYVLTLLMLKKRLNLQ